MGGEKWLWLMLLPWLWGSPPHGRGKVENALLLNLLDRITPAWAGKSFRWWVGGFFIRDHPRMGGEKPKERKLL